MHRTDPEARVAAALVRLPKLIGCDTELANLILGLVTTRADTCYEASRALLAEIAGLPRVSRRHAQSCRCVACAPNGNGAARAEVVFDPQDVGRRYLAGNGGCVYIDLDHLELALPEVLSARDHVAVWWAMLEIARAAMHQANTRLPEGQRVHVLASNSDGHGHSFGGHLNFMVTRRAWDNLMDRRPHYLGFLASYQASSIVVTGQGKVGSENNRPAVDYQLSQRADFFETLIGVQTTYRRPLVNTRDEALCGSPAGPARGDETPARVHCIFYDTNLSQVAQYLKVGVMQLVLAAIEAERVDATLTLDDPLAAVLAFSHDPTLRATADLADGRRITAIELQLRYLELLRGLHDQGSFDGLVPEADRILELWEETLKLLVRRDLPALAGRLDWALKLTLLQQALHADAELTWDSPAVKHLDHLYASLDEEDGLFWACRDAGVTERIAEDDRIEHFVRNPPEDTRAWARAMLLRRAGEDRIDDVDWDRLRFRFGGRDEESGAWTPLRYRRLEMPAPLSMTRAGVGALFDATTTLDDLLDRLGADAPSRTLEPVRAGHHG